MLYQCKASSNKLCIHWKEMDDLLNGWSINCLLLEVTFSQCFLSRNKFFEYIMSGGIKCKRISEKDKNGQLKKKW